MGFLSAFNKRPPSDLHQAVERFSALIAAYLNRLETQDGDIHERSLTLIARSPSAAAARALALQGAALERAHVTARLIFARLSPVELLTDLASALNLTAPRDGKSDCVRLIKTPGVLNAHEQLVLGSAHCWTGDMLRRCEENRNGLDLLEEDMPGSARLAQFAFNAIWGIAKPVPPRILCADTRPAAERAPVAPAVAAAGLATANASTHTSPWPTRH
jgi:hypothetical protein